ncbi:hypothetical protein [Rubritalea tangerina]|uniref:hypothetical protein n=1 Tax=Rubritalea tangerina TaxID=430798 RepID=UPI00360C7B94
MQFWANPYRNASNLRGSPFTTSIFNTHGRYRNYDIWRRCRRNESSSEECCRLFNQAGAKAIFDSQWPSRHD